MTSLAKAVGTLDGRGNLPLYQELQGALRKAIDRRILGPDDALPSERDLAVEFAVSRPRPAMQAI
jgi:GntR family transcriptional regulator